MAIAFTDNRADREGLAGYLSWWEQCFYNPYGRFDFGMGAGEPQDYLSGEEIDYLAGLVREPFPATMNFFTLFITIGTTYGGLFPVIEQERPEIMEKLIEMRAGMEDFRERTVSVGFPNR